MATEEQPLIGSNTGLQDSSPNDHVADSNMTLSGDLQTHLEPAAQKWSKSQRLQLVVLILAQIFIFSCYAIITPFFPPLAKSKGMGDSEIGLVFACFQIVMFVMSPVYGILIVKLNPKLMCVFGTFLCGVCCILFGCLYYTTGISFHVLCFLVRFVEGNGAAMLSVASASILFNAFPGSTSTISGLLEFSIGFGYIAGPAIGSALFQLRGYILPFVVVGGFTVALSLVIALFVPNYIEEERQVKNFLKLMSIPGIFVLYLHIGVSALALTYVEPVLSDWMINQFKPSMTTSNVGLVFAGSSACYALSSLFVGKISDKGYVYSTMIIGLYLSGIAYMLMAPSPILLPLFPGKKQLLSVMIISYIFALAFAGCIFVPSYQASIDIAVLNGYESNINTFGLISGMFNSAMSLGSAAGPFMSGFLTELYGFGWSTTAVSSLLVLMGLLMTSYVLMMKCLEKPLSPADNPHLDI